MSLLAAAEYSQARRNRRIKEDGTSVAPENKRSPKSDQANPPIRAANYYSRYFLFCQIRPFNGNGTLREIGISINLAWVISEKFLFAARRAGGLPVGNEVRGSLVLGHQQKLSGVAAIDPCETRGNVFENITAENNAPILAAASGVMRYLIIEATAARVIAAIVIGAGAITGVE
jgi:hypothetical protein